MSFETKRGTFTDRRKPRWFFKTKTFWLNALIVTATVLSYVASSAEFQDILKDHWQVLIAVTGLLNMLVRLYTTQPTALTRPPAEQHGKVGDD